MLQSYGCALGSSSTAQREGQGHLPAALRAQLRPRQLHQSACWDRFPGGNAVFSLG